MTCLGRTTSKDDVEKDEKDIGLKNYKFKKYLKCISHHLVPKTPPNPTPSELQSIFHPDKIVQLTLNQPASPFPKPHPRPSFLSSQEPTTQ